MKRFIFRLWVSLQSEVDETVHLSMTIANDEEQNNSFHLPIDGLFEIRRRLFILQKKFKSQDKLALHARGFCSALSPSLIIDRMGTRPGQVGFYYDKEFSLDFLTSRNQRYLEALGPDAPIQIFPRIRGQLETEDISPGVDKILTPLNLPPQMWMKKMVSFLRLGGHGLNPFGLAGSTLFNEEELQHRLLFQISQRVSLELWQRAWAPIFDWETPLL